MAILNTVASGGTATIKLQESYNDNTASTQFAADTYDDITDASVTVSGSDANSVIYIRTNKRQKKYVRVTITSTDAILCSAANESVPGPRPGIPG